MARIYFVHSLTQLNPMLWKNIGHPHVMVSADDVAKKMPTAVKQLRGLDVIVDSGGYRLISRRRLPEPEKVLEVQKALYEEVGAFPVLLDTPVPHPLRASDAEFRAANKATARNARLWQRVFGDHFLYPLHAQTGQQLREALDLARRVAGGHAGAFGLGSLAPLARYDPGRLLEAVAEARLLIDTRLHVFGVGNSIAILLLMLRIADSVDTSSPLADAKYGLARDPISFSLLQVAPRKGGRRAADPAELASRCKCPVCKTNPRALSEWGRRGILARTIHNAYHLLRAARDPALASRMLKKNRLLLRALSRSEVRSRLMSLNNGYECTVLGFLPKGLSEAPSIGVDVVS
ncbi:hypothetical protein PYJP_06250 [Pyrofollis japonicus]|uniref:hypothetical protein n=1 Tax=Pyrofollis japonicus TaxID=3060460 RepID=UPI00295B7013|nr:hypothetical protein [Pyrofollis japonicus]BEP17273.1 hypothetical protein PYJP_06250 [Pyrofollis japonicus]